MVSLEVALSVLEKDHLQDPEIALASYILDSLFRELYEKPWIYHRRFYYDEGGCFTGGTPLAEIRARRNEAVNSIRRDVAKFFAEKVPKDFMLYVADNVYLPEGLLDTVEVYGGLAVFIAPRRPYVTWAVKQNLRFSVNVRRDRFSPRTVIVDVEAVPEETQMLLRLSRPIPRELFSRLAEALKSHNVYSPEHAVVTEVEL